MDVNNLPLLEQVARTGKPVLMSTGMATLGEVERALEVLRAEAPAPSHSCIASPSIRVRRSW